jgi:tetratricopeptide (TPR) repeat protein
VARAKTGAQLVGFVNPTALVPSFLIPIFRYGDRGNEFLVQEIGKRGEIVGFTSIDVEGFPLIEAKDRAILALNDAALWAFLDWNETPFYGALPSFVGALRRNLATYVDLPMLHLQISTFLEDKDAVIGALGRAYEHLADYSRTAAENWRDIVVLPSLVREIILKLPRSRTWKSGDAQLVRELVLKREGNHLTAQGPQRLIRKMLVPNDVPIIAAELEHYSGSLGLPNMTLDFEVLAARTTRPKAKDTSKPSANLTDRQRGLLLLQQSRENFDMRRFSAAELLAAQALDFFAKAGEWMLLYDTSVYISDIFLELERGDEAISELEKALRFYREGSHQDREVIAELKIAQARFRLGHFDGLIDKVRGVLLRKFTSLGKYKASADAFGLLGDLYDASGQRSLALKMYLDKQLPIYIAMNDKENEVITRGKIAALLVADGNHDQARLLLEDKGDTVERRRFDLGLLYE